MRTELRTLGILALIPAAMLMFTGCSSKSKPQGSSLGAAPAGESSGQGSTTVSVRSGEPGGVVVQTHQETATVTRIDRAARRVTLQTPDGRENTVELGPEVVNFNQIQVGDRVRATVTEQLVVFVRDSREQPRVGQATSVALAPVGAKPGITMADTVEITAKVTAIDLRNHTATVQFPNGQSRTFKVRDDVDLTKRRVGEEVVLRSTEAVAISVEKI